MKNTTITAGLELMAEELGVAPSDAEMERIADYIARQLGVGGLVDGPKKPRAKMNADMVRDIRKKCAGGATFSEVARDLNLAVSTVQRAASGQTWAHVK